MRRFAVPALVAILAVSLVALLIFGVLQTGTDDSLDEAVARGERPVAHDARLPLLDGDGTKRIADWHGRYVVVNFFASWCDPCKEEAPMLNRVQRALERRGGTVLGVAWDDLRADTRAFVRENGVAFPVVRDVDGGFGRAYGVIGLPETFVVDPQGRVAALLRQPLTQEWIDETLDPLLAASGAR